MKLLTGSFRRAMDEKQRIAIPKRFREALFSESEATGGDLQGTLYVAPGTDGSLSIYAEEAFARLADRLAGASPNGQAVRAFSRLFFARAQAVDTDKQGRIRIPVELASLARLADEAMLIGVRDHLELWGVESWQKYVAGQEESYDELAERALAERAADGKS